MNWILISEDIGISKLVHSNIYQPILELKDRRNRWVLISNFTLSVSRLVFEKQGRYLTGKVIHYSGRTVVSASTSESAILEQLKSSSDVNAAKAVGLVLARRCLEAGILYVDCQPINGSIDPKTDSVKEQAFLNAVQENGLALQEPPQIYPRRHRDL